MYRVLLLLFTCFYLTAESRTDSLIEYYNDKVRLLDKAESLNKYYRIDKLGITIYADDTQQKIDFYLSWSELSTAKTFFANRNYNQLATLLKNDSIRTFLPANDGHDTNRQELDPYGSLFGKKIAIDPGHSAGDLPTAKLEGKSLQLKDSISSIKLIEANLTLQTALILKHLLEAEGATVLLTREHPNYSSFKTDFNTWMESRFKGSLDTALFMGEISEKEYRYFLNDANKREVFRGFYNHQDMKNRASIINQFQPDISIILHYNVDEKNSPWNSYTHKNYNMVFVQGSFMKNELEKMKDRFHFLRLLISDEMDSSILLSDCIINEFECLLNVPTAKVEDAEYLSKYCVSSSKDGVFHRNLSMTRMVTGTLAYGETLYQDNKSEALSLSNDTLSFEGIKTSTRVMQVAMAYYQGINKYFLHRVNVNSNDH